MSDGYQITKPFDEPYTESKASLPSSFSPSVVGIAGIPYLLDTESGAYRRESFDVVQQRNTTDARDVLLLPQDVWRQQAQSWHLGAGQSNQDRDDSLQYRFHESFGIDPWTRWEVSLLPETLRLYGTDALTGTSWLTTYGDYLAVVNDEVIYWYDELSVGSAAYVGSTVVEAGNEIIDIANNGQYVTTLHADGHVWETAGPGVSPVSKGTWANANFIAYQKDFLLLGKQNKLYDITGGGSGTLIYTSPSAGFRWNSAADGNSCIYVLGGIEDKYVVHRVGIKDDGTGLSPAVVAATLPDGEIGYHVESYLGYVLIGTETGVRVATQNDSAGNLTLGPIIPTLGPVRCFEGQSRFVWYGMDAMDGAYGPSESYFPTTAVPGLGRMDLSVTTTSALTPAYAQDICAIDEISAPVRSVVTFGGRRVFAVDGAGVWFEGTKKMEAGWLTEGTMSFSVEDVKTGLYVQAKWMPLAGEVCLDISYDSTGYIRLVNLKQQGTIRSGNISLDGTQFSRIDSRVLLRRDTASQEQGPRFTRWEVRAIPVKGRANRWTLPIMNYEETEIDGVKYTRDPLSVLDNLMSLVENGTLFTLQESGRAFQVHAKEFTWQPEKLTINGRAWQGVYTLVVEEVQ